MPIEVIITEGLLDKESAQQLHSSLSKLLLEVHGLEQNAFMRPNVIGEVSFIPEGFSFAGSVAQQIAIVELRAPSFVLATAELRERFTAEATRLVHEATGGNLPIDNIWVNMVYAVDGFWGISGKAYTNEELGQQISAAASLANV
ncbi:hypothetical protein [Cerasicoccus fimbriatus]|uniref:hypothetical protein n=1 Tax=Cerasicoccus fimbriatus TaxID=3014554 RepID=UPI0022B49489|nr:hypothetical protein [Cerasicoccus sp. TK19100]